MKEVTINIEKTFPYIHFWLKEINSTQTAYIEYYY